MPNSVQGLVAKSTMDPITLSKPLYLSLRLLEPGRRKLSGNEETTHPAIIGPTERR